MIRSCRCLSAAINFSNSCSGKSLTPLSAYDLQSRVSLRNAIGYLSRCYTAIVSHYLMQMPDESIYFQPCMIHPPFIFRFNQDRNSGPLLPIISAVLISSHMTRVCSYGWGTGVKHWMKSNDFKVKVKYWSLSHGPKNFQNIYSTYFLICSISPTVERDTGLSLADPNKIFQKVSHHHHHPLVSMMKTARSRSWGLQ